MSRADAFCWSNLAYHILFFPSGIPAMTHNQRLCLVYFQFAALQLSQQIYTVTSPDSGTAFSAARLTAKSRQHKAI